MAKITKEKTMKAIKKTIFVSVVSNSVLYRHYGIDRQTIR